MWALGFLGVLVFSLLFIPFVIEALVNPYRERDAQIAQQLEQKEGILICMDQRPPSGGIRMRFNASVRPNISVELSQMALHSWCKAFAKDELVPFDPIIFIDGPDGATLWITSMKNHSLNLAEFTFSHNMTTEALIFDRGNEVKVVDLDEL